MNRLGIDAGSTTVKCAVLSPSGKVLFSDYRRHKSKISETTAQVLSEVAEKFPGEKMLASFSGSASMEMAGDVGVPFVQEVYATKKAVDALCPQADTVIELGGEDAKILFLRGALEVRMNGTCAGGTGAFIDQMAKLMDVESDTLDSLAFGSEKIYSIASRCGVFAKTDVQPLINQGARKEDVAASIFYAVVNQTIGGLAQGREVGGTVLYLGGPLTFLKYLRHAFDKTLGTSGVLPENSLFFVAIGAALSPQSMEVDVSELARKTKEYKNSAAGRACKPLFSSKEEYERFRIRHAQSGDRIAITDSPKGKVYLGIDAGSTTVKALVVDEDGNVCFPMYTPNSGNPVPIVRDYLASLYERFPDIYIAGAAVTGYGESIIKAAFKIDEGVVETIAHYTAAKKFMPEVDFIIDIGGQDIKCFRIKNGAIDSIFLNEACSSGCGSFLQTFAAVLGYDEKTFASLALFAPAPIDLGSRCTVFMNSAVKQAQKDGANIEDISAGLAVSVVKNALYKVIRCTNPDLLGNNIVVQGGTFNSDAVLRVFERETGKEVVRPAIAGLMGAYGAALIAKQKSKGFSTVLGAEDLKTFTHSVKAITCHGCENRCRLTVNTFAGGEKYIAGNRCEKPLALKTQTKKYDLYEYKLSLLDAFRSETASGSKPVVGIPLALNMYELLPFWHTLFTRLGFDVITSPQSTHKLFVKGQHTIPSDTVCYPAKLVHGHLEALVEKNPDYIFYPSMSYNVDEGKGVNHYNCPVVAYYPEVVAANVPSLKKTTFIHGFIGIHDRKTFAAHFCSMTEKYGLKLKLADVKKAAKDAYAAYDGFMKAVRDKADEFLAIAEKEDLRVVVLAGRPYHIDPEINHGIDKLVSDLGAVVLTEDSVSHKVGKFPTSVLNQWTYHARLYAAAKFVTTLKRANLVQLVSFGCGVDAVTSDETRAILENAGKLYTQIKIDEITNLGAVKIRLRSLFAVIK